MKENKLTLNLIALICIYVLLWGLINDYSRSVQKEIDSGVCTRVQDNSLPFGAQRINCPKSGSIIISK